MNGGSKKPRSVPPGLPMVHRWPQTRSVLSIQLHDGHTWSSETRLQRWSPHLPAIFRWYEWWRLISHWTRSQSSHVRAKRPSEFMFGLFSLASANEFSSVNIWLNFPVLTSFSLQLCLHRPRGPVYSLHVSGNLEYCKAFSNTLYMLRAHINLPVNPNYNLYPGYKPLILALCVSRSTSI